MKTILKNEWTIALLAAILFIPFLGAVHLFDWDEINFAESAREMMETGNYFSVQINYQRFWEKPPLFFWMQVLCMRLFGVNEFAARLPNALCGILTLVVLFRIGKKIFDEQFARLWVMVYLGTFLSFFYFKTGIIDPWFNLFIFLALYQVYILSLPTTLTYRPKHAIYAGLLLGLAVLTKGPVAILLCLVSFIVFAISKRKLLLKPIEFLYIMLFCALVCIAWFGVDIYKNGTWFITQFIEYQIRLFATSEADHGEPFFYHWWVLLLGCFPASLFFIKGHITRTDNQQQQHFKQWMVVLFWVTLLIFSMVTTKIVHYSSLCWFPLTFLATLFIYKTITKRDFVTIPKWLTIAIGVVGILISTIITALPFIVMYKDKWVNKVEDAFARGNLAADAHFTVFDGLGGLILLLGVLQFLIAKNVKEKTQLLFMSVTICCLFTAILITPKIEAISQRANIEFFKARQGEDCYVETFGYKSYAHYYYTKKQPFTDTLSTKIDWLLRGKIDKPTYISVKVQDQAYMDTVPNFTKLYYKNGFAFYKRMP